MKTIINKSVLLFTLITLSFVLLTGCSDKKAAKEESVYYTCPMHPDVKKDEPGACPVCGMDLVKKNK